MRIAHEKNVKLYVMVAYLHCKQIAIKCWSNTHRHTPTLLICKVSLCRDVYCPKGLEGDRKLRCGSYCSVLCQHQETMKHRAGGVGWTLAAVPFLPLFSSLSVFEVCVAPVVYWTQGGG